MNSDDVPQSTNLATYSLYDLASAATLVSVAVAAILSDYLSRLDESYQHMQQTMRQAAERLAAAQAEPRTLRLAWQGSVVILWDTGFGVPGVGRVPPENDQRWFRQRIFWKFREMSFQRQWPPSLRVSVNLPLNVRVIRMAKNARLEMGRAEAQRRPPYDAVEDVHWMHVAAMIDALESVGRARQAQILYTGAVASTLLFGLVALVAVFLGW